VGSGQQMPEGDVVGGPRGGAGASGQRPEGARRPERPRSLHEGAAAEGGRAARAARRAHTGRSRSGASRPRGRGSMHHSVHLFVVGLIRRSQSLQRLAVRQYVVADPEFTSLQYERQHLRGKMLERDPPLLPAPCSEDEKRPIPNRSAHASGSESARIAPGKVATQAPVWDRFLFQTSKATAISSTTPRTTDWVGWEMPMIDMPLDITAMIRPPMIAPWTLPTPPVPAAPPMKAAARAS